MQGSSQQLPDSTESAEEEQESAALTPGHVWKHLGSTEDSTLNDGPARALPGSKHRGPGLTHESLQPGHVNWQTFSD